MSCGLPLIACDDGDQQGLVVAPVEVGLVTAPRRRASCGGSVGVGLHAPRPGRARATRHVSNRLCRGSARPTMRGVAAPPDRVRRRRPARARSPRRAGGVEGVFDAAGDRVDRLGVFADGVQRAVFAPAGDVGDRLAADVEADRAADDVAGAVDEHLGALAAVVLVADAEGVRELVHERAQPPVGGSVGDHDLAAAWGRTSRPGRPRAVGGSRRCSRARAPARPGEGSARRGCRPRSAAPAGRAGPARRRAAGRSCETSKTGTVRKKIRLAPVSSPCSSRSLTATGARMRIARSPLRTQRLSRRKARKPAT